MRSQTLKVKLNLTEFQRKVSISHFAFNWCTQLQELAKVDPPLQSAHNFSFSSVLVFTLINCTVGDLEEANTEAVIDRMPHPSSSFMTSLILTNKTRRKTIYRKLLIAQHSLMKFLQYVTCALSLFSHLFSIPRSPFVFLSLILIRELAPIVFPQH